MFPGLATAKKARLIPRKLLSSDERVVFEARPSAWLYMKSAALAIIIAIVALLLFAWDWVPDAPEIPYISTTLAGDYGDYLHYAFGALFAIAFVFFLVRWIKWGSTVYAATDERIIKQKGILNKTYEDIPVTMITNIDMAQTLSKRALGYGTLVFSTQGLGGKRADMTWDAVPDPMTVRRKLQEVMDVRVKPKK
jgi:membrane protein YdbS with pleckstrin-like domain